jgi:hypothetical protein
VVPDGRGDRGRVGFGEESGGVVRKWRRRTWVILGLFALAFNITVGVAGTALQNAANAQGNCYRDCPEYELAFWLAQLWWMGDFVLVIIAVNGAVISASCRSVQAPERSVTAATPFRFFATRSDVVRAPGTREPIGHLVKDGEYTAVEVSGGELLVEDKVGRRGWVPDSVVPSRLSRGQKRAGVRAAGDDEGGHDER